MKLKNMPIVATIIALICVSVMTGLGVWQLERKHQKETRLEQLNLRKQNQPFALPELLAMGEDNQDYPIVVVGELLSEALFFVDNKIHNGKVGFDVLVPLKTDDGILLLNHGWIQGLGSRTFLPDAPVEVLPHYSGTVYYPSNNRMVTETNTDTRTFPALIQQTSPEVIQRFFPQTVLPFVVNLDSDPASGFVREWTPVVMSPDKHLGYAVQWFGLAIACLTIYLLSLIKLAHPSSANTNLPE